MGDNYDVSNINLEFGNDKINFATESKFLGLKIDAKLSWEGHVKQLITKINKNMYLLRCIKNFIQPWTKRLLYFLLYS